MLIIVEGPDGAGKSTLVDELARIIATFEERPPLKLHCGPLKTSPLVAYEKMLEDYDARGGRSVVCDRWHLGELIYGPLLRGESKLTTYQRVYIDMFLASKGAVLVILNPPLHVLRRRLDRRGDNLITSDQLSTIRDEYRKLTRERTPVTVHVANANVHAESIVVRAKAEAERVAPIAKYRTYVGPPKPPALLLGDTYGPGHQQDHLKAFVPYPATSGAFLMRAIEEMAAYGEIGIANANNEPTLPLLHYQLGRPNVVALGRNALRTCRRHGVPCGAVPHPQYVRRFHHSKCEAYGELIARVAITGEDRSRWP